MDELDKKSELGKERFRKDSGNKSVNRELDNRIDSMLGLGNEDLEEPLEKKSKINAILIGIISLMLLGLIGYLGFKDGSAKNEKTPETKILFAQYFEALEDITLSVERGNDNSNESTSNGMKLYNQGNYKDAIDPLLQQNNTEGRLYAAISMLKIGKASDAAVNLQNIIADSNSFQYHDITNWYLSLAMISDNNIPSAINILKQIAAKGGYKSKEAKELLLKL